MRKKSTKSSGISSHAPGQRQLRVGELFRQRLCAIFARDEMGDQNLNLRLITITEVTTSADLRRATAYIMPLGGGQADETAARLNELAPRLRTAMSAGLRLKYVPELLFKADTSFDNAAHIDRLLARQEVMRDTETHGTETRSVKTRGVKTHGIETHGIEMPEAAKIPVSDSKSERDDGETA